MFESEFKFPHSYRLAEPTEISGAGTRETAVFYYPPPLTRSEHDGLWISCSPKSGDEWIGVFADEYLSPPAINKVLSTPDPNRMCVISGGRGYIVNSSLPGDWQVMPVFPITYAASVADCRLLVFGDFRSLSAWDGNIVWVANVAIDGLTVTNLNSDRIEGYGFDPSLGANVPFAVDVATGMVLSSGTRTLRP